MLIQKLYQQYFFNICRAIKVELNKFGYILKISNTVYAKIGSKLTLKILFEWTEITFTMSKCHVFFGVANLFLSEISYINIYFTKCRIFIGKWKTSFDCSNIMLTKYSTEV